MTRPLATHDNPRDAIDGGYGGMTMKTFLTLAVSLALVACGAEGGVVQFDTVQPIAAGGAGGSGGDEADASPAGGAGGDEADATPLGGAGGTEPDAHHPNSHPDAAAGGTEADATPMGGAGGSGGDIVPDAGPSGCDSDADCTDGNSCTVDVCNMTSRECHAMPVCNEALEACEERGDSFVCSCDPAKAFIHPTTQVCTTLPTGAACPNEGAFACIDFADANVNGVAKCEGGHWRLLADLACGPSGAAVASACNVDGPEDERGCFRQVTMTWTGFDPAEH